MVQKSVANWLIFWNIIILPAVSLSQNVNINSFQGNIGISCIDRVCFSNTGNGFYYGDNNDNSCNVIDNKIYKNGQYLRDMTPEDFAKMDVYRGKVEQWRQNLKQNILMTISSKLANPEHANFPWNPFGYGSPYNAAQVAVATGGGSAVSAANDASAGAHSSTSRAKRQIRQKRDYMPFPQRFILVQITESAVISSFSSPSMQNKTASAGARIGKKSVSRELRD